TVRLALQLRESVLYALRILTAELALLLQLGNLRVAFAEEAFERRHPRLHRRGAGEGARDGGIHGLEVRAQRQGCLLVLGALTRQRFAQRLRFGERGGARRL